ncbi:hypothetical protein MML48_4g00020137 [Holotrichia oblita]|uniref:Uncharacterized protein n=1 Tax=Holotrichia oblita TaxID=644536 RepID=A0ACB9T836_HOLOL|nr:hypothetical protein MML48_4g00020137 [Holotrichia oblita]
MFLFAEIVTELYTSTTTTTNFSSSSSKNINKSNCSTLTEKQLKCSSLPPGLAAPGSDSNKLNRSRSNAGTKYQEEFGALGEENESKNNKKTDSFLGRIFPRRSGKKRKSKEEMVINTQSSTTLSNSSNLTTTTTSISKQSEIVESSIKEFIHSERKSESLAVKPIPVPRSGAAARQRIQPNDIPASPELGPRLDDGIFKASPERTHTVSPLQMELETHFQQRLASLSTSPKSPQIATPPTSPRLQRSPLISPTKSPLPYPKVPLKSHVVEKMSSKHSRSEESRSKVIISGLSPFQQRVSATNFGEDSSDGFKSLNDLPAEAVRSSKLVAKSHSFKMNNNNSDYEKSSLENRTTFAALANTRSTQEIQTTSKSILRESGQLKYEIKKSSSLDNIENLDVMDINNPKEIFEAIDATKVAKPESTVVNTVSHSNSNEFAETGKSPSKLEATELITTCWTSEPEKSQDANIESVNFEPKIVQSEIKEFIDKSYSDTTDFINSGITISGPRHKAIVSVSNESSIQSSETSYKTEVTEVKQEAYQEIKEQISVTKIQVKQESAHVTSAIKTSVPEFMHIHLHKVEKPLNNVVLTAGFQSPNADEQNETLLSDLPDVVTCNNPTNSTSIKPEIEKSENCELLSNETVRKFSKEDIEIIEKSENEDDKKHVVTALVTITTMTPPIPTRIYKRNDFQIRKSLITVNNSEKPILKTKSSSLDIVESIKYNDENKIEDKSDIKTKTQSVNDLSSDLSNTEPAVPLRRKSMANNKQKAEDEPELMKVFARRSLKLKDNESECLSQQVLKMMEDSNVVDIKSRDSDKENQLDSPSEERKKIVQKDISKGKEPLLETRFVETPEVMLRKTANVPNNNKLYSYQRTISLNNSKTNDFNNYDRIQKQNSCTDRPKTDHWITYKGDENDSCTKLCQDEILASITEKALIEDEFCPKPKNFNQRKAEWEKRAQEASKKTAP